MAIGTLHLVSTPIGNLGDITLRAIETLRSVALIAAEDTRTARVLLRHLDIERPVTSYHDFSTPGKRSALIDALGAGDVALISEAGTPTLSDPGYHLVRAALDAGHEVRPVPGASALLAALAVSGLPTDQFVFAGFLPRRPADRRRLLSDLADERRTLVFYESPHRLSASLGDLLDLLGDRPVCVAREITKLYEEFFRGTLTAAREHFAEPRGEFTLVIGGATDTDTRTADPGAIDRRIAELLAEDRPPAEAARVLATEFNVPRRDAYERYRRGRSR